MPYGDEIILSRRTRKNLDTNQQDKIMDALSESEVGLIARHNLVPENLDIAQAELKSLNQQWKDIELNAKELNEEGLVFQNTYFDQNFVCDYSDKNTDQIIFSDHDRFEKVKTWDEGLNSSFANICEEMSPEQIEEHFNLSEKIDYLISKFELDNLKDIKANFYLVGKRKSL